MKLWSPLLLVATAFLALAPSLWAQEGDLMAQLDALEKAHAKEIAKIERPIRVQFLVKLKKWRDRFVRREEKDKAAKIDALITEIGQSLREGSNSGSREANFKAAKLIGGVRFDAKKNRLLGFNNADAGAQVMFENLKARANYTLEIDYASIEDRRLQFQVGDKRFRPKIANTQGLDQPKTLEIGKVTSPGKRLRVRITMPIFRSKDSIVLYHLRLVPVTAK